MAYNIKKAERMARRDDITLAKFVKSGSLSAAAALYALRQRHPGGLPKAVLEAIN